MPDRSLLSAALLRVRLKKHPRWKIVRKKLHRELRFADFTHAFAFMTAAALAAERLNHHPEWFNVWATVRIDLSTHDAGGITDMDFALAARMDALARKLGALDA